MRSTKCAWTLMAYKGTFHNTTLRQQKQHPGEVNLPDEDGTINPVTRYCISDPRMYLGVEQTTNGKEKAQETHMLAKIKEWNDLISHSRLPPALNLRAVMCKIY